MSDSKKPKNSATDESRIDDPMIDSLLAEVFGSAPPPDLSSEILRQWREASVVVRSSGSLGEPGRSVDKHSGSQASSSRTASSSASSRVGIRWATALVALAATVVMGIVAWQFAEPKKIDLRPMAESRAPMTTPDVALSPSSASADAAMTPEADPSLGSPELERLADSAAPEVPPKRIQPRNMTLVDEAPSTQEAVRESSPASPQRINRDPEPLRLVSARASEGLKQYWDAVGVTPSTVVSSNVIRDRLKTRLGIEVDESWLSQLASDDDESVADATVNLQQMIRREPNSRRVASAWLDEITSGAFTKLGEKNREKLVDDLAAAIEGEKSFGTVLSSWLSGDGDASSVWYSALAKDGEFAMVHRLGSLTMNVDLRCTRCHDAAIESDGLQNDYWSLAAMIRRDVKREESGRYTVRAANDVSGTDPVFYERLDGRQSMAEAGVPDHWLDESARASERMRVLSVRQWSDAIVDSRPLARGVLNSLWRLVHERPLQGDPVDAGSAPLDDSLIELEELLVDELLASDFDISRLLSIIVSSPATSRSIPEELLRHDAWAVDADKVRRAQQAVQAFAAASPSPRSLTLAKRVEVSRRSIGVSLKGVGGSESVLAQPLGESSTEKPKKPKELASTANGFPDHADGYPVQWLGSIPSLASQVEHLGYLAGRDRLPRDLQPLAKAMQDAEVSPELTLHRVWWLLQP